MKTFFLAFCLSLTFAGFTQINTTPLSKDKVKLPRTVKPLPRVAVIKAPQPLSCTPITNANADRAIKDQMVMQNIPGLAIAVFQNGELTHLKGYGYSDTFNKTAISTNTIMHWASLSKSVTATAALQLHQSSIDFNINDLATKHVSNWPNSVSFNGQNTSGTDTRHANITLRNLLMNRSGINHYNRGRAGRFTIINSDTVNFVTTSAYSPDKEDGFHAINAVNRFSGAVLDFQPGTNYLYSSYGYNLLGAAIEGATDDGYVDWVMSNIANPAGMSSLQVARKDRFGHAMPKDGMLKIITSKNKESVLPGGGWESNICDLAKYAISLSKGDFFDQNQDSLWSPRNSTRFSNGNRYGYGHWFTGSGMNRKIWHGGKHNNLKSFMHFFPSDNTGIVIISPAVYADLPELARHVYQSMNIRSNLYNGKVQTPMDECRTDMRSDIDRFHGIWRKTGEDVILRTGLQHKEFFEEYKRLKEYGYICTDFEPFIDNKKLYWDGVFKKGSGKTAIWRNFSKKAFQDKFKEMMADGYRLIDLETYKNTDGQRNWAGLFVKRTGSYALYTDRSTSEFAKKRKEQAEKGRKLIDIEVYTKDGKLQWSGVWEQGKDGLLNRNMTRTEFSDLFKKRRTAGYKIIDIEHYQLSNKEWRVAAIWEKSTDQEKIKTFNSFCDTAEYHENRSAEGYELIDWNRTAIEIIK